MMVSNFAYRSHKSLKISVNPFRMLAILAFLIGLLSYEPELIGFVFLFGYALVDRSSGCWDGKKHLKMTISSSDESE